MFDTKSSTSSEPGSCSSPRSSNASVYTERGSTQAEAELRAALTRELKGHVLGYHCDRIASMISPKGSGGKPLINHKKAEACIQALTVDNLPVAPTFVSSDKVDYDPLAHFFNRLIDIVCVLYESIASSIGLVPDQDEFWQTMYACRFDRDLDGDGEAVLKGVYIYFQIF